MSTNHKPRRGDKVNDKRRIPYANGFVVRVLYEDGPSEVLVRFDDGLVFYDYTEFEYTWTSRYGGAFELNG